MFGLPTHRTKTIAANAKPPNCDNPYGCEEEAPNIIKSALRLSELVRNHYTVIISADLKKIRTWGQCRSAGHVGLANNTNTPTDVVINWATGQPEEIVRLRSHGHSGSAWGGGWGMFHTSANNIYGAGANLGHVLNGSNRNTFTRILSDVIDINMAYAGGPSYLTYIKTSGRAYALGQQRTSGFGPNSATADFTIDPEDGTEPNYLGIDKCVKIKGYLCNRDHNQTKTFVIREDGTAYACGYNASGCLGVDDSSTHVLDWKPVVTSSGQKLQKVIEIFTTTQGDNSSYFLTAGGDVYVCGANTTGQLGLGLSASSTRRYAEKLPYFTDVRILSISAQGRTVFACNHQNEVWTWGLNNFGEAGQGNTNSIMTATLAPFPATEKIVGVHGGGQYADYVLHSGFAIITQTGAVYVAGSNKEWGLGVPGTTGQNITSFTRNSFFGFDAPKLVEPWRFPFVTSNNTCTANSNVIVGPNSVVKSVTVGLDPNGNYSWSSPFPARNETLYVRKGYYVKGPGIQHATQVALVVGSGPTARIYLNKPVLFSSSNTQLEYTSYPKAWQVDLCGYDRELSMKVVSEDGTLYQSGWNQVGNGIYNFNPRYGSDHIEIPTAFEANF